MSSRRIQHTASRGRDGEEKRSLRSDTNITTRVEVMVLLQHSKALNTWQAHEVGGVQRAPGGALSSGRTGAFTYSLSSMTPSEREDNKVFITKTPKRNSGIHFHRRDVVWGHSVTSKHAAVNTLSLAWDLCHLFTCSPVQPELHRFGVDFGQIYKYSSLGYSLHLYVWKGSKHNFNKLDNMLCKLVQMICTQRCLRTLFLLKLKAKNKNEALNLFLGNFLCLKFIYFFTSNIETDLLGAV